MMEERSIKNFFKKLSSPELTNRYFVSLFGNIAKYGLSSISGIIIARALGPASYGDLSFLLTSFLAINNIFST